MNKCLICDKAISDGEIICAECEEKAYKGKEAGGEYDCAICENAATPICDKCTYITCAGGEKSKPSFFLPTKQVRDILIDDITDEEKEMLHIEKADDFAIKVLAYIASGAPIPIRLVMAYNTLTDNEQEARI